MRICPAHGCNVEIPSDMAFCRPHWYALPLAMRNRIWASWRRVQAAWGDSATAAHEETQRHHKLLDEAAAGIA